MEILTGFLNEVFSLWLDVAPYLLFGMAVAGLLHIFLGKEFISQQLGKGGIVSVIKATLLGVPLPICSCGVIPVVSALEKDGAHKSSLLAFLVSTPTSGVDSILATYSLLGPLFAVFRPLAAVVCGVTLGVADYFIEGESHEPKAMPAHTHAAIHPVFHWNEFLRYSFREIPQDIGRSLIAGILIGSAIAVFLPANLFSLHASCCLDFIIALAVGIPLYVCATGSIPIAVSLIAKGFSPGAGLVFLIVGPATNAITLAFVRAKMGKKSFYLYLINIIIVAVLMGIVFNLIWAMLGGNVSLVTGAGKMLSFEVKLVCGVILLWVVGSGLVRPQACGIDNPDMEISAADIHCTHCKLTLESTLKRVSGVKSVFVDVKKKRIRISGTPERRMVMEKIKEAGYSPRD
ncbi:MAG: permease [Candidatus Omnitrophica bacterium]|nr:permease [Candidatus Omnitrophota bacterium]MBU4479764.1 permease [Candidatus Omnitrophota bacterium]MCG2703287.1 permease [Candidatus Omnitrophota bacterium]